MTQKFQIYHAAAMKYLAIEKTPNYGPSYMTSAVDKSDLSNFFSEWTFEDVTNTPSLKYIKSVETSALIVQSVEGLTNDHVPDLWPQLCATNDINNKSQALELSPFTIVASNEVTAGFNIFTTSKSYFHGRQGCVAVPEDDYVVARPVYNDVPTDVWLIIPVF